MLYSIDLTLLAEKPLSIYMSSLFQGVMMEELARCGLGDYAQELHQSVLHEYSIYLKENRAENEWHWIINLLNDRAYEHIWEKTLSKINEFKLQRQDLVVRVIKKEVKTLDEKNLLDIFKSNKPSHKYQLDFHTPVAFKRDGNYIIFPETSLILQSLIRRYDTIMQNETLSDPETFSQLCSMCSISGYKLTSTVFHLEGVKIPSFIGSLTLKCSGSATMSSFLDMLLTFGQFSGVGIKTSIGMGAYNYQKILRNIPLNHRTHQ